jgi:hypothetical protein
VVVSAVVLAAGFTGLTMSSAHAATTTLCQLQTAPAGGGTYTIQNNEWGSSASECITTDGGTDFTVANSSISNSTSGAPGGYASIYQGCHWGNCSQGGLSTTHLQVSNLTAGKVTTSWSTTQPGGGNNYDVAYDIWFNSTATTTGQPNTEELMVWLNHNGPVQPFGSVVASNVSIGGHTYNVWEGNQGWNTVSYVMTSGTTSVSNLDVGQLAADSVSRGYMTNAAWLIDVEAGFEMWTGGAGLATNSFSVNVNGSPPPPPPTTPPATTPPPPPPTTAPPSTPPAQGGGAKCTYSVVNSWSGGFQGQVVVSNTGSSAISGWKLGWSWSGSPQITSLWNGVVSQSGSTVSVTNAPYNSTISPGSSVTVGFVANGANATPSGLTLNGASC